MNFMEFLKKWGFMENWLIKPEFSTKVLNRKYLDNEKKKKKYFLLKNKRSPTSQDLIEMKYNLKDIIW